MKKLITLGVKTSMSSYQQRKARSNNRIAIMCAIIGIAYIPFLYVHYPELVIYPSLLLVISLLILALNARGLHVLTRPVNSFQMITLATLFHASIIQVDEGLLVPFFCTQLAMTLIPWVIFSPKEKVGLIGTLVICYGLLISQQGLNMLLEVPVDSTFFWESYLNPMTYLCAAVIQLCCMGFIFEEWKESISANSSVLDSEEMLIATN